VAVATPAIAVPGLTLVTAASGYDSTSSKEVLARCPSGTRILGGGGFIEGGDRQVHLVRLQALGSSDRFAAGAQENGGLPRELAGVRVRDLRPGPGRAGVRQLPERSQQQ
jgi:hypothetical protein